MGLQVREAPLPPVADAYMGYMRLRITEELAWMKGSPLYALLGASDNVAESADPHSSLLWVRVLASYISLTTARNEEGTVHAVRCMHPRSGNKKASSLRSLMAWHGSWKSLKREMISKYSVHRRLFLAKPEA